MEEIVDCGERERRWFCLVFFASSWDHVNADLHHTDGRGSHHPRRTTEMVAYGRLIRNVLYLVSQDETHDFVFIIPDR